MNKSRLTVFITLLISYSSFGQEIHFFSMYFNARVTEQTPYVRKYHKSNGQMLIEDYKNGKLQLSGVITGTVVLNKTDEFLGYIRSLGQESKYKEWFKSLEGTFKFYHESGNPSNEVIYKQNKFFYAQAWDEDGKEQLLLGTGKNKSSSEEYLEDTYEEYKDSLRIMHYVVRRVKKDTIHLMFDKQAEPREGIQTFYQNLINVLKYPSVARFVGKEGQVFIQFVVDENGKLTDFSPMTKQGYGLEKKVVEKLEEFPNWRPASFNGRSVKTRFVLPITYKLTD